MLELQKELVHADVRRAFDMVDIGGTDTIPKNKLVVVATKLQATAVVVENATLLGSSVAGEQELMSYDEVAAWWDDQWDKERKRKQVQEAFDRVDSDGGGTLDKKVRFPFSLCPLRT
jgi:Ca2+-binding EF-hand superfamily protein